MSRREEWRLLLRDGTVRKDLSCCTGLTAGLTLLGLWLGCALPLLLAGLCFTGLHLGLLLRRGRDLRALSASIDRVLHDQDRLLDGGGEGELAVLQSEIRKLTLRLRQSAELAEADKKRLSAALADVSHQLRTPLTAMNLTVTLLAAPDLPDERRRALTRELAKGLRRIDWLVETLLKLSRLDAGTVRFAPEPLPARALIDRAAQPLAVPLELRGVTLTVDDDGGDLTCDPAWTAEALGNVLKNCMEHTPEGGTITVTARKTALYAEITVRDTGPGIPPEDLPHLFERFYRGKNADPGSVGIGLALTRAVLAAQGATVQARNTVEGAVFTIRFYPN